MRFASHFVLAALAFSVSLAAPARAEDGLAVPGLDIGALPQRDLADHGCHVVLREVARAHDENGALRLEQGGYVWRAIVDVDVRLVDAHGAIPGLLARLAPAGAWATVTPATRLDDVVSGYARFAIELSRASLELPGPGWSTTGITRARLELIPWVGLSSLRLFDHNQSPAVGNLANYELTLDDSFAFFGNGDVCTTRPEAGVEAIAAPRIQFDDAGAGSRTAAVTAGLLFVDYPVGRLTTCSAKKYGREAWAVSASARFLPSGVTALQTVVRATSDGQAMLAVPARFEVPVGTTSTELWFETTSAYGCHAYDSADGENYRFDVVADR